MRGVGEERTEAYLEYADRSTGIHIEVDRYLDVFYWAFFSRSVTCSNLKVE